MADREYIDGFYIVGVVRGTLQPLHPGRVTNYDEAVRLAYFHMNTGTPCDIIDDDTFNALEEFQADSIHECQTEREIKVDSQGRSYWYCPACDVTPEEDL
jgi:hypothetical protein